MKHISILGSTGSIGTQALEVISAHPEEMEVVALACGHNIEAMSTQITKYRPKLVAVADEEDANQLQELHQETRVVFGEEGLIEAATAPCDMVLNGLMGIRGLAPTYHAICAGHDIALANKETLVAGGGLIMREVETAGVHLLPVDSEHSAIFQCLQGNQGNPVSRLILTGSGGPFRTYAASALGRVTKEQALRHPKWSMGPKITIDSATMMNKGLEIIEAKWLFHMEPDQIQVVIHPQSIVHSMVEFADSAVMAQLGVPDMKVPISYALTWPKRYKNNFETLDFTRSWNLTFEKPDMDKFRCLGIACEVLRLGGSYPAVMNAANEVLVELFLQDRIRFMEIPRYLDRIIQSHHRSDPDTLEAILAIDAETREKTYELCGATT